MEKEKDSELREKTCRLSIEEGSATSIMTGAGIDYITPYALALNANNAQIGFLSAFTSLISPFSQIFCPRLMEKYSRKKIITISVSLQAFMWLPILLLSLFFHQNIWQKHLPVLLIVFYSLLSVFGAIDVPAWFSLMGDVVPENIRGRYFGKRNKITGAVALITTVIAAFILDFFKTKGIVLLGFSILFLLASLARFFSAFLLKKHFDPELHLEKSYYFSLWEFIKKAPNNNFGRFVIYVSCIHLATAVAGPFFAVYMLKDLGFSYTTYMLIIISASVVSLIVMPFWGKFSDKYGNRELLKLGSFLIPFLPILWIFSPSPLYLILVPQAISGVGWAAFNLAASNFIYDCVTIPRRGLCVAYFSILVGIGAFIGASIGGLLVQHLKIGFMNKFLFIFLISGILRLITTICGIGKINEFRKEVHKPKSNPLLYFKEMHPVRGMIYEIVNDFKGIIMIFKKL